jgi:peptidyl-prolyl cis-trans isomerase D
MRSEMNGRRTQVRLFVQFRIAGDFVQPRFPTNPWAIIMFDAVRNNKRIVQVFLALITLPFAFWGIDSYMNNMGAGGDLASVGDTKISLLQFEQALRERQDRLRQSLGAAFKSEMMNSPEVRRSILNGLIDERLLLLDAADKRLAASVSALQQSIAGEPVFQEDGRFSDSRYQAILRAQGMSPEQFEARRRQELTLWQLIGTISNSTFVSRTQAESMLRIQVEKREVSEFRIAAASFAEQVKATPEEVRKFYDDNIKRFEVPEQVKAEYVVLSIDALMPGIEVSDAAIQSWYDDHKNDYGIPEERRASHILIMPGNESGVDKEQARARAEDLLQEVRQDPSRFAELARQHSMDPGSAEKGGDLGFFASGAMVKPFDDAVFSLKTGEISSLVETDYGYHIIRLDDIREAKERPLAEVRGEIENEQKRQAASRRFAEMAETFQNLVYEQSDSLQPVVDRFKLKIEQSDWIPRNPDPQVRAALGALDNDLLLSRLFSEETIKEKRNTEAVETAMNTLVAARVSEHRAAEIHPFEAVEAEIEKRLKNERAMRQAWDAGEARLAELRKGEDSIQWQPAQEVSRMDAAQSPLPETALPAILKADVRKLPAFVGVDLDDGYALFKITRVEQPKDIDENQLKELERGYAGLVAREDLSAYLSSLRARYKIDINAALLESRDR